MIPLIVASMLLASSPATASTRDQWMACARSAAESRLGEGVTKAWPKAASLPAGGTPISADLGYKPSEDAYDPLRHMLYAYVERNVIYIERSGGIADIHRLYGPIPLEGRCARVTAPGS
jgi:hypothetical protein